MGIFVPKVMLIKLTPSNLALSNLALYPKDFVLDSLNHVLFISLHVRAVELVILVKPIGILTRMFKSISFGTKLRTFLNASVLLKGVRISAIFLVLRVSIMSTLILNLNKLKESFHIEQLKPELNKQVEHVSMSLHF